MELFSSFQTASNRNNIWAILKLISKLANANWHSAIDLNVKLI